MTLKLNPQLLRVTLTLAPIVSLAVVACATGAAPSSDVSPDAGTTFAQMIDGGALTAQPDGAAGVDGAASGTTSIITTGQGSSASSGTVASGTGATGTVATTGVTTASSTLASAPGSSSVADTSSFTSEPFSSNSFSSSSFDDSSSSNYESYSSSSFSHHHSSSSGGDGYTCAHSPCTAGAALEESCDENQDDVVYYVCSHAGLDMKSCCDTEWTSSCANAAVTACMNAASGYPSYTCVDPGCG